MEANELMIGDWVRVPSELNRYMRIRSTFDMDSAILYESIPLTQEILKRMGGNTSLTRLTTWLSTTSEKKERIAG